jgi:hypothetical protein
MSILNFIRGHFCELGIVAGLLALVVLVFFAGDDDENERWPRL